ncbi:hypothetical protein D3C86_1648140 [compost metagenome]
MLAANIFMLARNIDSVEFWTGDAAKPFDILIHQSIVIGFGDEFVDVPAVEKTQLESKGFAHVSGFPGEAVFEVDGFERLVRGLRDHDVADPEIHVRDVLAGQ